MTISVLEEQISFLREIDKIKYIQRKTKLLNSDRHENDAEHSWHLAMMVIVLADYSNVKIDVLKVLKMVLIHDIVEIDAGDAFLFDSKSNHDNREEEVLAAKRIFGILPDTQATEFITIWEEFEAGQSVEAKFAKAIDHLEPVMQNASNNGGTWTEFDVPIETVIEKKKVIKEGSEIIWDFAKNLIDESEKKGHFKD